MNDRESDDSDSSTIMDLDNKKASENEVKMETIAEEKKDQAPTRTTKTNNNDNDEEKQGRVQNEKAKQKKPDAGRNSKTKKGASGASYPAPPSTVDVRTTIRQFISPYLPPPVVVGINQTIDPMLKPYVGPEASVTISLTLLLSYVVFRLLRIVSGISTGGRAIADEEDDDNNLSVLPSKDNTASEDFGDTVLLCGPQYGGKTRLFYYLAYNEPNLQTVMSVRANMALIPSPSKDKKQIRLMDYPGHASLRDPLFLEILRSKPVPRIIFVVDSTQNVSRAAEVIYELLRHTCNVTTTNKNLFSIFIACHKSDVSHSKNPRRIKIQVRTELERLLKVRSAVGGEESENLWWPVGKPLDLDQLPNVKLCFAPTSCKPSTEGDGTTKLSNFCFTGEMP